jgi:hypothetical protein
MEIFRRLGIAGTVRAAGLPIDYPNDVAFRTTATGIEMARIPIPCRAYRYTAKGGPDTWWPTPEPPHRINQIYLEPVLFDHEIPTSRPPMHPKTRGWLAAPTFGPLAWISTEPDSANSMAG